MFDDEDGACVYCDLFSCYASNGANSAHYDSKNEDIYIALKQLSIRLSSSYRVVIFSDSPSALQSVANKQHSDNIRILLY